MKTLIWNERRDAQDLFTSNFKTCKTLNKSRRAEPRQEENFIKNSCGKRTKRQNCLLGITGWFHRMFGNVSCDWRTWRLWNLTVDVRAATDEIFKILINKKLRKLFSGTSLLFGFIAFVSRLLLSTLIYVLLLSTLLHNAPLVSDPLWDGTKMKSQILWQKHEKWKQSQTWPK